MSRVFPKKFVEIFQSVPISSILSEIRDQIGQPLGGFPGFFLLSNYAFSGPLTTLLTTAGEVPLQLDQGGGGILLFHVGVKISGHLDGGVSHKVLCSLLANAHPVEI